MNWLDRQVLGNSVWEWGIALAIGVALAAVLECTRRIVARRLRARRHGGGDFGATIIHALNDTRSLFVVIVSICVGALALELPAKISFVLEKTLIVALLVQATLWGNRAVAWWLEHRVQARRDSDAAGVTTLSVLGFIARVVLWSVAVLMVLDNLGVDITALVASLGIGGIAVALALQNVLGDLFASLSIALDKPFVLGDFIIVGDTLGTVEYIGLKTTRIRSLSGEQIVFANADLLKSRIRNFKRMFERRIVFGFGIVYETEPETVERIPAMVRAIVEAQPKTRFDRAHFKEYGESSLNFEVVYFVLVPDFNTYMDIQQAINFTLFRRFRDEGIAFAYPTRTLHLSHTEGSRHVSAVR